MSDKLIDQLNRLAEIAPEVCQRTVPFNGFAIGEYSFWPKEDVFVAQYTSKAVTGRPALALLESALEGAFEARGWNYEHRFFGPTGNIGPRHKVLIIDRLGPGHIADTKAEALLAALIAALEER